jgi:N-acyl-D-aspartate/D-glutamate deacylase
MLSIVIEGGTLFDGTGGDGRRADVGIEGDRIAAIGDLSGTPAAGRIAARGLAVAPGFIDIHTHSDFTLLVDGAAESQIRQGVTTEIVGQCGFSCAPLSGSASTEGIVGYVDAGVEISWRSFGAYLDRLAAARPALNVGAFVGHGAIRLAATDGGTANVPAMAKLAETAFDEGALGLSTGLEYWPGSVASAEEIQALVAVSARRGALYSTHVRNRDVDCARGFDEALETARATGARLQISHIQPKYGAPEGALENAIEAIDAAARDGVDAAFDVIPHDWNHTIVMSCLPGWAREGGLALTLARLGDPDARARIKAAPSPIWRLVLDRRWERIVLLRSGANPGLVGETFEEIGRRRGCDPFDAVLDLLLEEDRGAPGMMWTSKAFRDADVCACLRHSRCSVMSDTLTLSRTGSLADMIGSLSGYGWVARLLGHYARDRGILTLGAAVARITSRPAERLGLRGRGRLAVGAFADVTVFDPATVADRATVREPRIHPDGFHTVIVNGQIALVDGQPTGARGGRVLRGGNG